MEQEAADAGKVAMDTDLAVVKYLQGNNKKLAVFSCFHTFGDLDVFNIVVQTLEDGERPQFEVMAGIGCAVVDVVGVFAWIAEQLDIVTDGVFAMGVNPPRTGVGALFSCWASLGNCSRKKSARRGNGENALTPSFSNVM